MVAPIAPEVVAPTTQVPVASSRTSQKIASLKSQVTDRFAFLIEYLNLAEATGDPRAKWELYQLAFLLNDSHMTHDIKARQIGWSWIAAAEAVACAILTPNTPNIFVSINLEEAQEKIRYAKAVLESLDYDVRPRLIVDNRFELEFPNGSRLISHPCRPVRGKAKARVYLDEFAHYPKDREIYTSALPVTTRGGVIRMGSSPLGASGMFWEIGSQALQTYPAYARTRVPWWASAALCKDVELAAKVCPDMPTEERVKLFGRPRLVDIFENMLLEDFQQEYECNWVDESVAWIPWPVIKRNQALMDTQSFYRQANDVESAEKMISEVWRACREHWISVPLVGGMDIGRKKNLTEIILLGIEGRSLPYRLGISLDRVEYDAQYSVVKKMLDRLPIVNFLIDGTGMGAQFGEDAERDWPSIVESVVFTNPSKEMWAVETKLKFERAEVPIPMDRSLAYQIHSIKKMITSAKNVVFDTKKNEKHHADKFWALALAIFGAKSRDLTTLHEGPDPTEGYRGTATEYRG